MRGESNWGGGGCEEVHGQGGGRVGVGGVSKIDIEITDQTTSGKLLMFKSNTGLGWILQ